MAALTVLAIVALVLILAAPIVALVAIVLVRRCSAAIDALRIELETLRRRVARLGESGVAELPPPAAAPVRVPREAMPGGPEAEAPAAPEESAAEAPVAEPVSAPPPVPAISRWEARAAPRLLTWAGAVALFLGAAFFLKYAFEQGWLGPVERVLLGLAGGILMVAGGERLTHRGMRVLGQGLIGGGLAVLYATLYAAFDTYELISQPVAFAAMVGVTALGVALAVAHDALAVSVLALIGGLLTPLLVSTGQNNRDVLFTYLMLLDVGVMGAVFLRRWRFLDTIAFVGTWAIFAAWYNTFYQPAALVPALVWAWAFFLLFLTVPSALHLLRGIPIPFERSSAYVGGVAIAYVVFGLMLRADMPRSLAVCTFGLSLCCAAMAVLVRRFLPADEQPVLGLSHMAAITLTLGLLHGLTGRQILVAWAVEGPALLALGHLLRYRALRVTGIIILATAALRLFFVHWPLHDTAFRAAINAPFAAAMAVPLAGAAYAVINAVLSRRCDEVDRALKTLAACCAGLLALALVHAETALWMRYVPGFSELRVRLGTAGSAALLWAGGAAAFLAAGRATKDRSVLLAGLIPLAVSLLTATRLYRVDIAGYLLFLNQRFGVALSVVLVAFAASAVYAKIEVQGAAERLARTVLCPVAALGLLALLSAETYRSAVDNISGEAGAEVAQMALSVVWSVCAAVSIVVGFWRRARWLRIGALVLFAVTAAKVVAVDMHDVERFYRIITFLALGGLMIAASYVYQKFEKRLLAAIGHPIQTEKEPRAG